MNALDHLLLKSVSNCDCSGVLTVTSLCNIHIFGSNQSLNQSMRFLLESALTTQYTSEKCLPQGVSFDETGDEEAIFLFDAQGGGKGAIEARFIVPGLSPAAKPKIVLFNVDASSPVEKIAGDDAIWGIFYQEDSKAVFLNGMKAILNGKKWIPRNSSVLAVRKNTKMNKCPDHALTSLSKREKEILRLLAYGMKYTEIAAELGISIHTVKTHVHRIYKKIDAPNRFQATLWVLTHFNN